jgi:hypothetical protein
MRTTHKNKNRIISLAILLTLILATNNPLKNELQHALLNNDTSIINQEFSTTAKTQQGVEETINLMPSGVDASHLYQSPTGDPLWTYPASQSYLDTYWDANPSGYTEQNWNPENKFMQDSVSEISGSEDFYQWEDGVGSVRLDAARRDQIFRLNDSTTDYYLSDVGGTPTPTGGSSSAFDNAAFPSWGAPQYTNGYYPGNMEGAGGTDVYRTDFTNFDEGNWAYGNAKNTSYRELDPLSRETQSYSLTAKRLTWYELYYDDVETYDRIQADWDTEFEYSTEFRLYFYYDNTSSSTNAFYGADISLNPVSLTEQSADFDVDISGSIQYDIYLNDTTPSVVAAASQTKYFADSAVDGSFPSDSSVSIAQSGDFGGELTSGMYFLRILVNITHHMYGSIDEYASYGVSRYFSDDIGLNVQVSNPYVSISESTPINPQSTWGSVKIDQENYAIPESSVITHDSSTTATSPTDFSFSHTLGYDSENERLLVAFVGFEDDATITNVSSVTYNGQVMTRLADKTVTESYSFSLSYWYLLDADLPISSGSYTVAVDMGGTTPDDSVMVSVSSYTGVKQSAPYDVSGSTNLNAYTISTLVDTERDNSVLISVIGAGNQAGTATHTGASAVKQWELTAASSNAAGGDITISLAGSGNIDEYDYGATLQNRMVMISASWSPYIPEYVEPETTYLYMGSTSPNIDDMTIESVHIHVTDITTVSVGVWTGGTLSDPTSASLLVLGSQIDYEVQQGWNEISLSSLEWPKETITWIGVTTNGSGAVSYTEQGEFTHFSEVSGAWNQTSPAIADPTNAMGSNIGAGAFIPFYYAVYIEYDKGFTNQSFTFIESDWVDFGAEKHIASASIMNLTFGYQIPTALRGYDGESKGLEYARIMANLTIEKNSQLYTYSQTSPNSFADVREIDMGYGIGCDKFTWNVSNAIKTTLNFSTRIKWNIGILFEPGFELGYNYSVVSQVYFNNINCTVEIERPIYGTFDIEDLEGNTENAVNITIFDENLPAVSYSVETTAGTATFPNLYIGDWRIVVNKTIAGTGKTVVIYNSTRVIDVAADFTDTIANNLTNIIFNIQDYLGAPITTGEVTLSNVGNPSDILVESIDGSGEVFFQEIYNGNWGVSVKSSNDNVILNFTKTINSISPTLPDSEKYLITDAAYTTFQANLTNIEMHVMDPLGLPTQDLRVSLINQDDDSITFEGITDSNGNITITEIYDANWQLLIYSTNNYIIYNHTDYPITLAVDMHYPSIMYNLTNLEFQLTDYAGTLLSNTVSPIVTLANDGDNFLLQSSAVGGLVTFSEVYNGSAPTSWRLTVAVSYLGESRTIFNSTYNIATNGDLISDVIQANRTTLELTLYDRDNLIIPNAVVNLTDSTNSLISYEVTSDSEGKIQCNEIYESTWILTINYAVSGSGSTLTTSYTIYQDNLFSLSFTGSTFVTTDDIFNCNLTTLDIWVLNHNTDRQYAGLYQANVTLQNFLANENITTMLTSPDGFVSIRLPSDTYNFSIEYQGNQRDFHFNDTEDLSDQAVHNKTISYYSSTEMNITLSIPQTKLSITDILIGKTGISGWDAYNGEVYGQSYDIATLPYYLNLYMNDSVEFAFFFETLPNNNPILPVVTGSWNLTKDGINVNSSSDLNSLHTSSGIYNLSLFTEHYTAGSYELTLEFQKTDHLTAFYSITINILNHTTNLARILPLGIIENPWNEDLVIWLNYTSLLPETGMNITNAEVSFTISGTAFENEPMLNPIVYSQTGVYELNISKWSLDVGVYSMVITASEDNYITQSLVIVFTIVEVDTQSSHSIDVEFRVTSSYLKVAYGENITVFANFSYYIPSESNFSALINVDFSAYMDTVGNPLNLYNNGGTWQLNCTDFATQYSIGIHTLYLIAEGANHEIQIIDITVEIVDYWDTNAEIIQNPSITPWGNNATFIIEYSATEAPREGWVLENASISQLYIKYIEGGDEYHVITLDSANYDYWRWEDLGDGRYQIWLNTSLLEVIETKDFYIVPSVNYSVYAEASAQPVLWVSPLETSFNLYANGNPVTLINLYLDESATVLAQLKISETTSGQLGNPVNIAYVYYEVYNISVTNDLLEIGSLLFTQDGLYELTIDASKIGNFTVKIFMSLTNHTLAEIASFTLRVGVEQADFSILIPEEFKVSDISLKVAHGENISFYIDFLKDLTEYPELSITIGGTSLNIYDLEDGLFLCSHPAIEFVLAEYTITITSNQLYAQLLEKELELEIMNYWETALDVDPFDFEIVPWSNITRFSMIYSCIEAPRDSWLLDDATIDRLYIQNSEYEIILTLTELDQGISWNWTDLTGGEYEIWINTTFLEITGQEAFFVTPSIYYGVFSPKTANAVISVRPVEVTINLFSQGALLPVSFELGIGENKTITAVLNITDMESFLFGLTINTAQISFIMYNASDASEIFDSAILSTQGNGEYEFNITTPIAGDFRVVLYLTYLNHTLTSTPQFLFDTGLDISVYTITIESEYRISSNSLKVAHGENITFSIIFPNLSVSVDYVKAMIGAFELTIYDLGSGEYLINHPANSFPLGLIKIDIFGKQVSHKDLSLSLQLEILDFWDTRLELVVPPVIYPWNNISTFEVRYICDEFPRENDLLTSAIIRNVTLSREINGNIEIFYILNQFNMGDIWGWSKVGAEYTIWFNTSIVSVYNQSVVYVTPYLYYGVYREASVDPYVWIRPVETHLSLYSDPTLTEEVDEVTIFLDQSYTVYSFLNISDAVSNLFTSTLEGAIIYYDIYQKLSSTSQILYQEGNFTSYGPGISLYTLIGRDLGSYVVYLRSFLENYTSAEISFEFVVQLKPINLLDQTTVINTVIEVPQNRDVGFTLEIWDSVHNVPLTDATVLIDLDGTIYEFHGNDQGQYSINFTAETLGTYDVGTYNLRVEIQKTNYTFTPIYISLTISLPVDQYLNIPYLYWIIFGATALFVTSVTIGNRLVKLANIPPFMKKLYKTKKLIKKNKEITDPMVTQTQKDEFLERFGQLWKDLNLDLADFTEEEI